MNKHITALIFGVSIVVASFVLGKFYVERNKAEGFISVTGLGKQDFTSDLVVWEGYFGAVHANLQTAYKILDDKKQIIKAYLMEKGISENKIVFLAVNTEMRNKDKYTEYGKYIGSEFVAYSLNQSVQIESKEVDKIEKVSREITELLDKGVQFYSEPPRYYYTQLTDLKIEMISKATEDARLRAESIAKNSGGSLGKLVSAKMGVFQITGQNSSEDYSWGGVFNTSSKEKTASITVKLKYKAN